jgi:LacI family transcriptional regulator
MTRHAPRPSAAAPAPTPVGIKDIARSTGVSIGTVDRALHDKPGISPATRRRVLDAAAALGYRPNLAARRLKSGKRIRIAVQLPKEIALFWDSLREGIREGAAPFEPGLQLEFNSYPGLGQEDAGLFEEAVRSGVDGMIIAPGDPSALGPAIDKAVAQGVAVACVVTDAPDTRRLTAVSPDPCTVGGVAGELLARFLPAGGGRVAFFTGWLGTFEHAQKLHGFEASLADLGNGARLSSVVEAHDDERAAYDRARDLLARQPDLRGIYVSTVCSLPVLKAVEEEGRLGQVIVVTTDLFPELLPWIRGGAVAATLYQRPLTQGRRALQALFQYLTDGIVPPPRITLVPHVVMRSNLDLVLESSRAEATLAGDR